MNQITYLPYPINREMYGGNVHIHSITEVPE